MTLPAKLNGRSVLTDKSLQKFGQNWIDYIEHFGTGQVKFSGAVSAFYQTSGKRDRVWVTAAKGNQAYTVEDLKGTLTKLCRGRGHIQGGDTFPD